MTTIAQPLDSPRPAGRPHAGPPLGAVGVVFAALFVASLAAFALLSGGAPFPRPTDPPETMAAVARQHATALRAVAFFQFGSAIPLGIFTATVASRLRYLGINAAGPTIALFGGVASSLFLALSALVQWVLVGSSTTSSLDTTRALQLLAFAAGGPGHVVTLGLLVAGVAVSGGLTRNLSRRLMWSGLAIAAVAELSSLTLLTERAVVLLPLARFPAFIWIIAVGIAMPRQRRGGASA